MAGFSILLICLIIGTIKEDIYNKNRVLIDHIGQSGIIWVTVNTDNGTYQGYLYIDDNGTQKRLEMKNSHETDNDK
jgi:hypothetical protein